MSTCSDPDCTKRHPDAGEPVGDAPLTMEERFALGLVHWDNCRLGVCLCGLNGRVARWEKVLADRTEAARADERQRVLGEADAELRQALVNTLAQHQRITSKPGGPCWCREWPRDDVRRDTWMDHVADVLLRHIRGGEDRD